MSLPAGNLHGNMQHFNTQSTLLPINHVNPQQLRVLPQSTPLQPADPSVSGFPPPHPLQLQQPKQLQQLQQMQLPQQTPPPVPNWVSLRTIQQTLMPNDPQFLPDYTRVIEQVPDRFMGLTYQDLTLELYLRDASAVEPPRYLLVDMVTMVGPAPIVGTQEHRAWMLNKYSYWIPFTKFVAEYQVIEPSDIPKLIALVQLFTNHSMLDPVFVYECFAFALYWCPMFSQTGVEVARLRNMMFHLHRHGLILNGPLTPTG